LPNIHTPVPSPATATTNTNTNTNTNTGEEQLKRLQRSRNFEPAKLRCREFEDMAQTAGTLQHVVRRSTENAALAPLSPTQLGKIRRSMEEKTSKMYSHFPSMLELILSFVRPVEGLYDGTLLVQKGEKLESIIIVVEGALVEPEKIHQEGSVLGIENLLDGITAQHAVLAWTDAHVNQCVVAAIDGKSLRDAMREHSIKSKHKVRALIELNAGFANLPPAIKDELGLCLREKVWERGEHLMTEGDTGEDMIFIEAGVADVTITKGDLSKVVAQVQKGAVVGEGALFDATSRRSASVVAKTPVVRGRSLSYQDFHTIIGKGAERFLQELFYTKILTGTKTFKSMPTDQIDGLSASATTKHYAQGEYVVREGDVGTELFIVVRGTISFFKQLPNGTNGSLVSTELGSVFSGAVFGEGALVDKKPRSASCIATSENGAECAIISFADYAEIIKEGEGVTESLRKDFKERDEGDFSSAEVGDLEAIYPLGQGVAGTVMLVRHQVTGRTAALKAINIARAVELGYGSYAAAEASILKSVHHPFLCVLYRTLKHSTQVFLVMEPVLGGELLHVMMNEPDVASVEKNIRFYVGQCLEMLCYLHRMKIAYRDMKPENLLLGHDGYLKLIDFGFAKKLNMGPNEETFTMCGTPEYMAPEVYSMSGHNTAADWWSLGIVMHEMFVGMVPFQGESTLAIMEGIGRYSRLYPDNVSFRGNHISENAANLMLGLLCPREHKRLGYRSSRKRLEKCELYAHPFFEGLNWRSLRAKVVTAPYIPKIVNNYDAHNFAEGDTDIVPMQEAGTAGSSAMLPKWTQEF
jgi:CRP-like cAMP-binding protein